MFRDFTCIHSFNSHPVRWILLLTGKKAEALMGGAICLRSHTKQGFLLVKNHLPGQEA